MPQLAYPVCKEFLGLQPKPLYYSLLYIILWYEHMTPEGFLLWSEDMKIVQGKAQVVCMISEHFPSQHGIQLVFNSPHHMGTLSCSRKMLSTSLPRLFFLDLDTDILKCLMVTFIIDYVIM
jgi:hypothetical protein